MIAINHGTANSISVLELVKVLEGVDDLKWNYEIEPRREGNRAAFWTDATKAEIILGWVANYSVEGMCRSSWNFANMSAKTD